MVYRGVRWGLSLVFLWAGLVKLANPASFVVIIEAYGLVPEGLLMPIAVVLPTIDVLAAIGLKESAAVKGVREVQRGDDDVVTTDELKKWIDSGKAMVIIDTMPLDVSYKKQHVPGAVQFLFPIPEMETWDVKETDGKSLDDYAPCLGRTKTKPLWSIAVS